MIDKTTRSPVGELYKHTHYARDVFVLFASPSSPTFRSDNSHPTAGKVFVKHVHICSPFIITALVRCQQPIYTYHGNLHSDYLVWQVAPNVSCYPVLHATVVFTSHFHQHIYSMVIIKPYHNISHTWVTGCILCVDCKALQAVRLSILTCLGEWCHGDQYCNLSSDDYRNVAECNEDTWQCAYAPIWTWSGYHATRSRCTSFA